MHQFVFISLEYKELSTFHMITYFCWRLFSVARQTTVTRKLWSYGVLIYLSIPERRRWKDDVYAIIWIYHFFCSKFLGNKSMMKITTLKRKSGDQKINFSLNRMNSQAYVYQLDFISQEVAMRNLNVERKYFHVFPVKFSCCVSLI